MDAATIAFLAIVVLASGFIAYVADLLGRKLGKKRLTIGKLRPRHTAALGTVLSGMIISILTIALVMLFSSDVREWILKGNAAIREAQQRVAELEDAKKQLRGVKAQLTSAEQKLSTSEAKAKEAEQKTAKLQGQLASLESQRVNLEKERDAAKSSTDAARRDLSTAQRARAGVERKLLVANNELTAKQKVLNSATDQLNAANTQMIRLDHQNRALEKDIRAKDADLKKKEADLQALDNKIDELNKNIATAQADLTEATTELDKVKGDLEDKKLELDIAKADVLRAKNQLQMVMRSLNENLANTRMREMILQGGEEVARIQLSPHQSADSVRAALENVLTTSRREAEQRGAKAPRGGVAASIKDQQIENRVVTAQEQMDAVIQAATNLNEEVVIISSAFWNVFEEEDVPLLVVAYRNPLIYKQGQIVAEARIDGRADDGTVLKQLTDFLSDKLKKKALADKMIPAARHEQSLGSTSFEELFTLARDIKDSNRQVRLVAVAKQDTRAADPLRVDLRIR